MGEECHGLLHFQEIILLHSIQSSYHPTSQQRLPAHIHLSGATFGLLAIWHKLSFWSNMQTFLWLMHSMKLSVNNTSQRDTLYIQVLFIHQMMHYWVVLKNNIKIYIKIYIKTAPTCFGISYNIIRECINLCLLMCSHTTAIFNHTPMYFNGLF